MSDREQESTAPEPRTEAQERERRTIFGFTEEEAAEISGLTLEEWRARRDAKA